MTMSAYSSAIVDKMLGWLKGFANWVLLLFHLAGSSGTSPLLWLSQNWLRLLILLLILGVAGDIVVWLVRWRPYWVWFRKERVIVDDEHFFNDYGSADDLDPDDGPFLEKNWQERDYVVASTAFHRRDGSARRRAHSEELREKGRDERRVKASVKRGERRERRYDGLAEAHTVRTDEGKRAERQDFFSTDGTRPSVTDYYEDEVFNVNSLPVAEEFSLNGAAPDGDDQEEK